MILRDEPEFTIECAIDDEWSRAMADSMVRIYSRYRLDTNPDLDPIGMDVKGIQFILRYKKFS